MNSRFLLCLVCALSASSSAFAQDLQNSDDGYLAPKLVLGFGGEAEVDPEGPGSVEDDLELTYGLGLAYMHPLHQYFALGGQVIVASWQTEAGEEFNVDRSSYVDISLVPQLKYAVSEEVELYASIPIGLTLNFLGEDEDETAGTGVGFNLALMLGARFAIGESWGLLGEIGYQLHSFTHTVEVDVPVAGTVESDVDISLAQIGLNLGVWFAL
jgi:hypothetical protein